MNLPERFKLMKLVRVLLVLLLVVPIIISTVSVNAVDDSLVGTTINVYNWGEYIPDGTEGMINVNELFTQKTGIKVNYITYPSNEEMYAKLKSGGVSYDIVIPSDYMIERMISEGMLQELDFSNIPNYDYILDRYKSLSYDPENKYSVPYTVGMVGLIYNKEMVNVEPDSWSILWDDAYKGKILQFDNSRDAFAIAQFLLGIDVNSEDHTLWDKAADKLIEQKPLVKKYVMDEIFNMMESGEAALAPYYAGDYLSMVENNPDLGFVYPKEGTNYFVDAVCIPSSAQNKAGAEAYINFLLDPEIATAIAECICYASPHSEVVNNPDYEYYQNPILYPAEEMYENTQIYRNLSQMTLQYVNSLWDNIYISGVNYTVYYIVFAIIFAFVVGVFVFSKIKKKRRDSFIYDE